MAESLQAADPETQEDQNKASDRKILNAFKLHHGEMKDYPGQDSAWRGMLYDFTLGWRSCEKSLSR